MKQSSGLIERQSFAKIPSIMGLPNLVDIQKRSYREFLQEDIPPEKRSHSGLQAVFQDIFPMASGSGRCSMEFVSYSVGRPEYSAEECQGTGRTYNAPLKLRLRLVIRRQAEEAPEKREQEVYLGELPLMTEGGSFIINGAERVVVSQLHRSPGVCFEEKIHPSGRRLCSVRIIPYRGTWLELEFDTYDVLSVVIDRRRRILVTTLLRALGYSSSQDIIKLFYETETIRLGSGLHRKKFLGRFLARDVRKGGEVIGESGEEVSDHLLRQLKEAGVEKLTLVITPKDEVSIINTLRKDHCRSEEEAQLEIFRRLRPGDPPTPENARRLLHRLFFDPRTYDLARVGRYKLNRKLGLNVPLRETTLRREDMVEIIRYLLKLKKREGTVDDIDHLGSRRVRTVGESVANQFRVGLERMERFIRERMSSQDLEDLTPQNLVNPKMISSAINNFFGRSQLSQFMDQVNPLAELTHKRRLSALGPGGLSRERAGFEVRDVHFSHYGRICPIETPEGTNIGLIVSMSTYAQINDLGFLKTPYRKVRNGKATRQIEYLSADVEDDYVIAQANAKLDAEGRFTDDKIFARLRNDFPKVSPGQVQYMDVSPEQLVSVSTALIPFLEHDDANRALMGSNMQRQAVPLLWAEAPLVGTGMERPAAVDSGAMALSFQDGKVEKVSANAITIRSGSEVHEYSLKKFLRSNQDTCLNQRPVVQPGERVSRGQVIADGPGTHLGELALGRDILVAFMPWWGYNFEDAILVSEKVVKEDVYTSIHIEEFELEARDTKLGPEEITRDIPNVGEEALKDLGENGIIRIGAEVRSEDILAGKITPKGETELSPEEKLLRAIFGEKAGDVRDASLRVPPGVEGIVIDVKVFSRREGKGPRKSGGWAAAELPSGVNKLVKVYIASKRKLSVGDKIAGRHGNKGVIAKILPEEDMPFLPDGTPVEIVLNPLGVPSRMNLGQILETHLGWAARALGIYVASPVFSGANEEEIKEMLRRSGLPGSGTTVLYDGRSGEPFQEEVTVGYIYMMKLVHLVDDKIHARSIGPYSLVTQQPLGGRAQFGGQRFGEMEVWALESYGAAYTLQELLTVKSDDVAGRTKIYETIVKGENTFQPGTPESFNVLIKELQSLGLDVKVEKKKGKDTDVHPFDTVSINIASMEAVKSWSRGEVKKAETINYRTFRPEKDGLFCEKIFGPTKDWECNCGKYKRIKYKGVVCDRCGVEVTQSRVRRERMGHIKLACPVSHIWFFKVLPSRMGALLGMSLRNLEKVLYYEEYVVINPGGDTGLKKMDMLGEEEYRKHRSEFGDALKAKMGAEAIRDLLKELDLGRLAEELRKEFKETSSQQAKIRITKRLKMVESFRQSNNKPEWMIMDVIPVIPPDLRPLVPLDGGRFATSDLNDLYRRVLNRNNRLKKLLQDPVTPGIIIRNEKRMLQEAVDAVLDNGRHGRPVIGAGNRPLKSLSDTLKGKQGRFRQNLLGKRVDYSGRSVIVIDPELKLHQCGLPKKMALELFEPFIIRKLKEKDHVHTIKSAKRMVESIKPEVWDILEEVIKDHPVLLNRAPTLHRLGIQAFHPVLVEGKAIHINPLICTAFNADFDGDQMAVHVPLSIEAQMESRLLILSPHNILSPSHGRPIAVPTQDIVLGCHYLTKEKAGDKGEGKVFAGPSEVSLAREAGEVGLQARARVRIDGQLVDTTVGRVLFNEILPPTLPFINKEIDKDTLSFLIGLCYREQGYKETAKLLDSIKKIGFKTATLAGMSIAIDDIRIPPEKEGILEEARREVNKTEEQYRKGVITDGERYNKIIDTWTHATDKISDRALERLKLRDTGQFNPIFMMADCGARGSRLQVRQLAGMRGLMAKPSGEIIESPITANFREGLTVLEYFLSTHGGRKGLADTALKTADSGYLTRRLVDVAQDLIVTEEDCSTLNGIVVEGIYEGGEEIVPLKERVFGRVTLDDILIPQLGEPIVRAGEEISEESAEIIEDAGIEKVRIRSVLTCEAKRGVCARCYGRNLATGGKVELGEAIGIIAAQSIGEPGTQLTMRTFHIGGTASRTVEQSKIVAKNDGILRYHNLRTVRNEEGHTLVLNRNGALAVVDEEGKELERHGVPSGAMLRREHSGRVSKGELFVQWDPYTRPILTEVGGKIKFEDIIEGLTMREELDKTTGLTTRVVIEHKEEMHPQIVIQNKKGEILGYYSIPSRAHIVVKDGQTVSPGELLAKTPREITGTVDITGGLPRIVEIFEARRPKAPAIITEIDGVVEFAGPLRGKRRIVVKNDETGMVKEYLIPPGKHLNVYKGDRVTAGQQLIDGPVVLQDILRVRGMKRLQEHLLNDVQEVYRLQGVAINDKHIEVIIRQMLRKVEIEEAGGTSFLVGEQVGKFRYQEENERVIADGGKPARAVPVLLGITKASLTTDSFISAASFQETTRILAEAAFGGKIDELRGLKENVIMGHLIPAGTGMGQHREIVPVGHGKIEVVKNADNKSVSQEGKKES